MTAEAVRKVGKVYKLSLIVSCLGLLPMMKYAVLASENHFVKLHCRFVRYF